MCGSSSITKRQHEQHLILRSRIDNIKYMYILRSCMCIHSGSKYISYAIYHSVRVNRWRYHSHKKRERSKITGEDVQERERERAKRRDLSAHMHVCVFSQVRLFCWESERTIATSVCACFFVFVLLICCDAVQPTMLLHLPNIRVVCIVAGRSWDFSTRARSPLDWILLICVRKRACVFQQGTTTDKRINSHGQT